MIGRFWRRGREIITSPQNSVLSAAAVVMVMVVASRVLGLVRQRVLAHYFDPESISLFFAGLRLPELVFEILVFSTMSSALIPVFTKTLAKDEHRAWDMAARVVNLWLVIFVVVSGIIAVWAEPFYRLLTPGFSAADVSHTAQLSRLLFIAQGFFVVSYVMTGVLESQRRFLIPAIAPVFYNVGIIVGIVVFAPAAGLVGAVYGVMLGAFLHFCIQVPLALKLGFRFRFSIFPTEEVRKVFRLALPRMVDVGFSQIGKLVELSLASIVSTASYTYFTFANTLQALPVGLFATSVAKASLPMLASQADEPVKFKKTLLNSMYQIVYMVLPIVTVLIVLRIPIVRLAFGAREFDWEATVQTGLVLSAFCLGVVFQAMVAILARGFYALTDTKTPVMVSLLGLFITVVGNVLLVRVLGYGVWALAASYSFGVCIQSLILLKILLGRINNIKLWGVAMPIFRNVMAAVVSGGVMFFLLKFFDRSVWVKRLSFFGSIAGVENLPFERFVLDTRYTLNLFVLTAVVAAIGMLLYLGITFVLGSPELRAILAVVKRGRIGPAPVKETETLTDQPLDTG